MGVVVVVVNGIGLMVMVLISAYGDDYSNINGVRVVNRTRRGTKLDIGFL